MSAVVDSSVLVAARTDGGPSGIWAEAVLDNEPLVAPAIAIVEAFNVLRKLEASAHLERTAATVAAQDILRLRIELFPLEPLAGRVWQLRHNLTCYDAWYVALAESLDFPLATLDARLARASGPLCSFLLPG